MAISVRPCVRYVHKLAKYRHQCYTLLYITSYRPYCHRTDCVLKSSSNVIFWHVYVLGLAYFVWPWKSRAPHVTSRTECNIDVTPGTLTATDTCIWYHVTRFEASRNVIFHTRYVSTCVGAVCVLGLAYFVWPWKSRAPHVTSRTECNIDVALGTLTATDTCIGYHVTRFEASRNVILHTRYVSTCVGAVCGKGRGTKINITDTHNNNTCDKYKSSLRHIHDPLLSSLKMKGIRLLFFGFWVN
jgi:hypothetical protein